MHPSLNLRALSLAALWSGLAATSGRAAAPNPAPVSLSRDCIAAEARKLDFSGVVSLAQPGVTTTFAQGSAAGPGSAAITPASRFNLGSASKMFTAVAVAQLIDVGKVGLDDPIGRYVHGLTAEASLVTVRQLLNHSSGLGNYFAPQNLAALMRARTLRDLLPLVTSEKPAFEPGSRFAYSDTGFLLLGLLVEQVSGQTYGVYLQGHIFRPAGMRSTGLEPPAAGTRAVGMTAMSAAGGPPRAAPEAALQGGSAGGAYSTVGDMQRFFAALEARKLTSAESFQMLVSTQIVAAKADGAQPERDYGFGFGVGRFDGHRWFGHNGGAPGVNTEATVFPDNDVTVVVLANRDPPAASALFRRLRAMLFDPTARQACDAGAKTP